MSRREWTYPELRDIVAEVEGGRTWDEAAAPYGVSGHTARTLVRRHNIPYDLSKRPTPEHKRADLVLRAIALRNTEELSWPIITDRVGWPGSPEGLRQAAVRYCRAHGHTLRRGYPDQRRTRSGTISVRRAG